MARRSREQSATGIYHVMLRGIDRRDIFLDDQDRKMFLFCMSRAKEKSIFTIYAYCIMDNHVHLLMKGGSEPIGESIKRITVGYVQWHNLKYLRAGHLFQNRYKSEVVENERYFLTAWRYIHQNPIQAGLVKDISAYKWSSIRHYLEEDKDGLVSTDMANGFFANQAELVKYLKTPNSDECLEYEVNTKYTDEKLRLEVIKIQENPELIAGLPKKERNRVIKQIKHLTGASNRQLSRVLGIGRGIIEKI